MRNPTGDKLRKNRNLVERHPTALRVVQILDYLWLNIFNRGRRTLPVLSDLFSTQVLDEKCDRNNDRNRRNKSTQYSNLMPAAPARWMQLRPACLIRHGVTVHLLIHRLIDPRRAHPSANAHRHNPILSIASRHLAQKGSRQLSSCATQWMPQRNRAAVDIHLRAIDPQ